MAWMAPICSTLLFSVIPAIVLLLHINPLRFSSFPQEEDYGKSTTQPQCSTQRAPVPATGEGSARALETK